jgi:23S rRNA pseudouridine2605 synthase
MEERVQKILARLGYGSRRSCEDLIIQGRVTVNSEMAEIGSKADAEKDRIFVDGREVPRNAPKPVYIMLHKPQFVLSVLDDKDTRKNVFNMIPDFGHLFAVGRLDFDSEGLILLTNDGELANRLTHPRYGHEKEYKVLVLGEPDAQQLRGWRSGVVLEDGYRTQPASVEVNHKDRDETWLTVIMKEGRKRQIREIGARIGLPVKRILRVRLANLELGKLKLGQWRHLTALELADLKRTAGIKTEISSGRKPARPNPRTSDRPAARKQYRPTDRQNDRQNDQQSESPSERSSSRLAGRPASRSNTRTSRNTEGRSERPYGRSTDRNAARPGERSGYRQSDRSSEGRGEGSTYRQSERNTEGQSDRPYGRSSDRNSARPGGRSGYRQSDRSSEGRGEGSSYRQSDRNTESQSERPYGRSADRNSARLGGGSGFHQNGRSREGQSERSNDRQPDRQNDKRTERSSGRPSSRPTARPSGRPSGRGSRSNTNKQDKPKTFKKD